MSYGYGGYGAWAPRKTVAQRRADAAREIARAARRGQVMSPVVIDGRTIAHTFWGKAWCDNLERYRDFAYRLERGRSYVRSGSVIDLRIEPGKIVAKVSGSRLYDVSIAIAAVARDAWRAIQRDCASHIGSRLDLLSGQLSQPVMARLCADRTGLFPPPPAIRFTCSCPDWASMCKHVAAAMYGVGARLDATPELLFVLRRVSADELHAAALSELPPAPRSARVLAADGLASLFGIELADQSAPATGRRQALAKRRTPTSGAANHRGKSTAPEKPPKATRTEKRAPVRRTRKRDKPAASRAKAPRTRTRKPAKKSR